jgi:ADP-ribose pyrophosphatase YjhB (NUDIX family)
MSGSRMLLHRDPADPFWTPPGGRVEFGETSEAAVRREWAEELRVEPTVGRLLWVAENFFTYRGERYHEMLLLYALDLPADTPFLAATGPFAGFEEGAALEYAWIDLGDSSAVLRPPFLRDALVRLPDETVRLTFRQQ